MYCPWTGLGLYNGFRGNKWLCNRIKIFKQFVLPTLKAQKDFILWCSWRNQERYNRHVKEFIDYLAEVKEFKTVHTFSGVCFWDDKFPDEIAHERLISSLHGSMSDLINVTNSDFVLMTIQPSDDCYSKIAIKGIQEVFEKMPNLQAFGFLKGYLMNYRTGELAEYNPKTTPPFFTIGPTVVEPSSFNAR